MSGQRVIVDREDADFGQGHDTTESGRGLVALLSFTYRLFASMALLVLLNPNPIRAQEQASDSEIYHLAVDYCRGAVPRPMALSPDQRLLCFDGWVDDGMDLSLARELKEFGLFVVRSFGGHDATAVALSRLLGDRHATVVVYDYCVSACANSFFIASDETYVVGGALVAWRNQASAFADCTSFRAPQDRSSNKVAPASCPPFKDVTKYNDVPSEVTSFYSKRTISAEFKPPPISAYVSRTLKNLYDTTGVYVNVGWTLNPRYHSAFKTKIIYESYPNSQDEVDAIVARLRLGKVIYDP